MATAHARWSRGRVRDREGGRGAGGGSAAAHGRALRAARRRARAVRVLPRARTRRRLLQSGRVGCARRHASRRPLARGWPRAGHAAVPRLDASAGAGGCVLRDGSSGRCDLPRRTGRGARHRSRDGAERPPRAPHHLPRYYRTYPAYVEEEVRAALRDPARQFERGPISLTRRDSAADPSPAFVVEDGCYLSARWPGDAYSFARASGGSSSRAGESIAAPRRAGARSAEDPRLRRVRARVRSRSTAS